MLKIDFREMREAERAMLMEAKPVAFITHNFNQLYRPDIQKDILRAFYSGILRKFARNDGQMPSFQAHAYRESPFKKPHYHSLVIAGPEIVEALEDQGEALWRRAVRQGQLDVQVLEPPPTGAIIYCTKDLLHAQAWDDRLVL